MKTLCIVLSSFVLMACQNLNTSEIQLRKIQDLSINELENKFRNMPIDTYEHTKSLLISDEILHNKAILAATQPTFEFNLNDLSNEIILGSDNKFRIVRTDSVGDIGYQVFDLNDNLLYETDSDEVLMAKSNAWDANEETNTKNYDGFSITLIRVGNILSLNYNLEIRNLNNELLHTITNVGSGLGGNEILVSLDAKLIITCSSNRKLAKVTDISDLNNIRLLYEIGFNSNLYCPKISPDKQLLMICSASSEETGIKILDLRTGNLLYSINHNKVVLGSDKWHGEGLNINADGRLVITRSSDSIVKITDLKTPDYIKNLNFIQLNLIFWMHSQNLENPNEPIRLDKKVTNVFLSLPEIVQNALAKNYNLHLIVEYIR